MQTAAERKPALGFIFVTLVLLVLGFGIIIPVLPGLVTEFQGGDVAAGSHAYGWLVGVFALMQFVGSPILGALSDRFGRRKVILIALAGSAIDLVMMGFAPNLTWLFIARVIAGLTAGAMATCNAYIADVTPPEKRAQAFGLVGAAFGLGFVIGPAVGGLLGHVHLRLPFFGAAACVAINWVYGALVLPESLPPERRRAFDWKRANPIGALLAARRLHGVLDLACVFFCYTMGSLMVQSIWVLYTGYRYGWTTREVGLSLTFVGVAMAVVQGKLVRPIVARLGEQRAVVAGLFVSVLVSVAYGLATQGWMVYCLVVVGAFAGIAGPAVQALITRHVPPTEQGTVQGMVSSLMSLAGIFAPMIGAWSFGAAIAPGGPVHVPGIAFFEGAALTLLAIGLAVRSFRKEAAAAVAAA